MARLSAYGQRELARVRFTRESPQDDLVIKSITERAFMSNGRILERRVVWFKPDAYDHGKARRHDYRWTVKVKAGAMATDPATVQSWLDAKLAKGWERVEPR